jgi:hypothetical protein
MSEVRDICLGGCEVVPTTEDEEGKEVEGGGGVPSTTATIHPLEAATQWARGGRMGRVAEIWRSSSSMSSVD